MTDPLAPIAAGWRADADRFRREVAALRDGMERELGDGAERAARRLEGALTGAIRKGSLGFEDLRKLALSVLADIASAAVRTGLDSILGGGGGGGGTGGGTGGGAPAGLVQLAAALLGRGAGLPGRATGGPVSPGRAYTVGERGPEVFVPTGSGAIVAPSARAPGPVTVNIRVDAARSSTDEALTRSSRQVAAAVRRALEG